MRVCEKVCEGVGTVAWGVPMSVRNIQCYVVCVGEHDPCALGLACGGRPRDRDARAARRRGRTTARERPREKAEIARVLAALDAAKPEPDQADVS